MKQEIEKRLNALEEYVSEEMDKIRNLSKKSVVKDLFSITTYSEVCEELKEKEETCPYKMIKQVEKLFNGEWKKDWNGTNRIKWYPWYEQTGSGLVFSHSCSYCVSFGGQVAFYKDKQTCDYVGKHFISIYKQLM